MEAGRLSDAVHVANCMRARAVCPSLVFVVCIRQRHVHQARAATHVQTCSARQHLLLQDSTQLRPNTCFKVVSHAGRLSMPAYLTLICGTRVLSCMSAGDAD